MTHSYKERGTFNGVEFTLYLTLNEPDGPDQLAVYVGDVMADEFDFPVYGMTPGEIQNLLHYNLNHPRFRALMTRKADQQALVADLARMYGATEAAIRPAVEAAQRAFVAMDLDMFRNFGKSLDSATTATEGLTEAIKSAGYRPSAERTRRAVARRRKRKSGGPK